MRVDWMRVTVYAVLIASTVGFWGLVIWAVVR